MTQENFRQELENAQKGDRGFPILLLTYLKISVLLEEWDKAQTERGATYSHRNGETEPPEIEGCFFILDGGDKEPTPVEVRLSPFRSSTSGNALVVWYPGNEVEELVTLHPYRLWWGPVPKPTTE